MERFYWVCFLFFVSCATGNAGRERTAYPGQEGDGEIDSDKNAGINELQTFKSTEFVEDVGNGFFRYRAERPDGSEAFLYANRKRLNEGPARPAMIIATGSGCKSVFRRLEDGKVSRRGLTGYFVRLVNDQYTILVMEKRGVEHLAGGSGDALSCSKEYHRYATRPLRIEELLLLVGSAVEWKSVDSKRIVLFGHSEGTDVVSGAAARAGELISHVGFLAGGGPTQMFDFVLMVREKFKGQAPEVVEKNVSTLMEMFRDVFRHPTSTEKMMFGHPYSRWAGFFKYAPVEDLLQVDVPLFVAHGSEDTSVPITSADFIEVEFIRHGKTNLTFRRYPGLDHSFKVVGTGDKGRKKDDKKNVEDVEKNKGKNIEKDEEKDEEKDVKKDLAEDAEKDGMTRVIKDFLKWVEST